jgi:hypothetical protein
VSPRVWNKREANVPRDAVYVGRPSPYGNPYTHLPGGTAAKFRVSSREEAIRMFEERVLPTLDLSPLRGRDLVCWCAPKSCHADVLLREANK